MFMSLSQWLYYGSPGSFDERRFRTSWQPSSTECGRPQNQSSQFVLFVLLVRLWVVTVHSLYRHLLLLLSQKAAKTVKRATHGVDAAVTRRRLVVVAAESVDVIDSGDDHIRSRRAVLFTSCDVQGRTAATCYDEQSTTVMLRCRDRKFRYIAILFVGLRLA